jgi:hypothetical protein
MSGLRIMQSAPKDESAEPERRRHVDSPLPRAAHLGKGKPMLTDRLQANRLLAITGFTLCFLFLLAVIVLAFD